MAGKEQGRKKYQQQKNINKNQKNKIESPTLIISKK